MTTRRKEELEKLRSMLPEEMPTSENILYSNDRVIDADKNAYILALGKAVDMAEAMSKEIEELCTKIKSHERELPVVVYSENDMEFYHYKCPNCEVILHQQYKFLKTPTKYSQKHCHYCGQKLSWKLAKREV